MMYRLLFVATASVGLLSLAPAAPVPKQLEKKPVLYFPTKVGAKFIYSHEMHFPDRSITYRRSSCTVTAVARKGEAWLVTTRTRADEQPLPLDETLLVSDGCLTLIERNGKKCDPPFCLLKQPHGRRGEWEETAKDSFNLVTHTKYEIHDTEEVVVPAGRFRAVPVKQCGRVVQSRDKGWTWTHWYAPGVGCIKSSSSSGTMITLTSFTPGKD